MRLARAVPSASTCWDLRVQRNRNSKPARSSLSVKVSPTVLIRLRSCEQLIRTPILSSCLEETPSKGCLDGSDGSDCWMKICSQSFHGQVFLSRAKALTSPSSKRDRWRVPRRFLALLQGRLFYSMSCRILCLLPLFVRRLVKKG